MKKPQHMGEFEDLQQEASRLQKTMLHALVEEGGWVIMMTIALIGAVCVSVFSSAESNREHESYQKYLEKASESRPLTFKEWKESTDANDSN